MPAPTLLPSPLPAAHQLSLSFSPWRPPIELFQHAEALFLQIELPGVAEGDFELDFANGCLILRGQRRFHGRVPPNACCLAEEIHYGPFQFELAIHPYFDAEEMAHEFADGMLRIRVPRRSSARRPSH